MTGHSTMRFALVQYQTDTTLEKTGGQVGTVFICDCLVLVVRALILHNAFSIKLLTPYDQPTSFQLGDVSESKW
jgi:hypothetical protein